MPEMEAQPLIVYKTHLGEPVGQPLHFRSTIAAIKWLRSEGCRIPNILLARLGEDTVTVYTDDYEYEIESGITRGKAVRRGPDGAVKN